MKKLKKGDEVEWKWGKGKAKGIVEKTDTKTITKRIKNSSIKRKGSKENPVLQIKQKDASNVIKLQSEVNKKA